MRRKSHLLLIFGGVVFLIYYKWKSASSDIQERSLGDVNIGLAPNADVERERQPADQFDDALYYQGSENDTSADSDLSTEVGEEGELAGDDQQAVGGEGGYLAQGEEEKLHLDIGQDQGAGPQPELQQLAADGQQQAQNVQEGYGIQQAVGDQQLIPDAQQQQQQQPQQQVQGAQPGGQLEGQLQAGQQLLAGQQQQQQQLQVDPQQPQNVQAGLQQLPQNAQPMQPQQQLPA